MPSIPDQAISALIVALDQVTVMGVIFNERQPWPAQIHGPESIKTGPASRRSSEEGAGISCSRRVWTAA